MTAETPGPLFSRVVRVSFLEPAWPEDVVTALKERLAAPLGEADEGVSDWTYDAGGEHPSLSCVLDLSPVLDHSATNDLATTAWACKHVASCLYDVGPQTPAPPLAERWAVEISTATAGADASTLSFVLPGAVRATTVSADRDVAVVAANPEAAAALATTDTSLTAENLRRLRNLLRPGGRPERPAGPASPDRGGR